MFCVPFFFACQSNTKSSLATTTTKTSCGANHGLQLIQEPALSGLLPDQNLVRQETTRLQDEINRLARTKSPSSSALHKLVMERAHYFRALLRLDPKAAYSLFDKAKRQAWLELIPALSDEAKGCLEVKSEKTGKLEILFAANATTEEGPVAVLTEESGKRYRLTFASKASLQSMGLATGASVRVAGLEVPCDEAVGAEIDFLDPSLSPLAVSAATDVHVTTTAASTTTFGEHPVAVVLLNFNDATGYTATEANNAVFDQANRYWLEASFGQAWITGHVFGPFSIPLSKTTCDYNSLENYANIALANAGIDVSAYKHRLFAFPANTCGWLGLGTIGGAPGKVWINGSLVLHTVAHELGHNIGLYHSHAQDCGPSTLATDCASIEYGDTTDVMGNLVPGHYNAFQKERLGWLNSANMPPIITATATGNYSIDPFEANTLNAKAIKIPKSVNTDGSKTYYYLEFRQPLGFDAGFSNIYSSNLTNGIVVHTGTDTDPNSSFLLDLNPEFRNWYKAALTLGQTFQDSTAGISITVNSVSPAGASVNINLSGQPACVRAPPSLSISPSESDIVTPGESVHYSAALTNNDSTECAQSVFSLQTILPTGFSGDVSPATLSIAPGQTSTAVFWARSPDPSSGGSFTVRMLATNTFAPIMQALGSAVYLAASDARLRLAITLDHDLLAQSQYVHVSVSGNYDGSAATDHPIRLQVIQPDGGVTTQDGLLDATGKESFTFFASACSSIGIYQLSAHGLDATRATIPGSSAATTLFIR